MEIYALVQDAVLTPEFAATRIRGTGYQGAGEQGMGMAGLSIDPAGKWEESQTLDGRVLFFLYAFCCVQLQIPSYRIFYYEQEKACCFLPHAVRVTTFIWRF
ncbi:hypothetical protein D3Z50_14440 [Clostridiaceae bacterium]|nr:hypothetical protein [Clostridiaceae bacterium]